jgi:hypothetical protein
MASGSGPDCAATTSELQAHNPPASATGHCIGCIPRRPANSVLESEQPLLYCPGLLDCGHCATIHEKFSSRTVMRHVVSQQNSMASHCGNQTVRSLAALHRCQLFTTESSFRNVEHRTSNAQHRTVGPLPAGSWKLEVGSSASRRFEAELPWELAWHCTFPDRQKALDCIRLALAPGRRPQNEYLLSGVLAA